MKKTIYLYKSGTLSRQDHSLVLKDKKQDVTYLPIEQIDTLLCFGDITLNKRCLGLLNTYHINVSFFNYYGEYIGRYAPKKYLDGKLLMQQVRAYQDEEQRVFIAKTMIRSSLSNCLSLMKYYNKKGFDLKSHIQHVEKIIEGINYTDHALLLLEAQARKKYYEAFNIVLAKEAFTFEKRTTNPPRNEINAMLSYGYSLLYANYLSVLDRSRLYSQISFIHSMIKSDEPLQYDLADIMKPVLVDRLVLSLCRHKEIKKEYFMYRDDGRCYLNKEGARFFVARYEDYLKRTIVIKNKAYSYKSLISREVHLLSNYLSEKDKVYKPYIMKW